MTQKYDKPFITVLTQPACGQCVVRKSFLARNKITFVEQQITQEQRLEAQQKGFLAMPILILHTDDQDAGEWIDGTIRTENDRAILDWWNDQEAGA